MDRRKGSSRTEDGRGAQKRASAAAANNKKSESRERRKTIEVSTSIIRDILKKTGGDGKRIQPKQPQSLHVQQQVGPFMGQGQGQGQGQGKGPYASSSPMVPRRGLPRMIPDHDFGVPFYHQYPCQPYLMEGLGQGHHRQFLLLQGQHQQDGQLDAGGDIEALSPSSTTYLSRSFISCTVPLPDHQVDHGGNGCCWGAPTMAFDLQGHYEDMSPDMLAPTYGSVMAGPAVAGCTSSSRSCCYFSYADDPGVFDESLYRILPPPLLPSSVDPEPETAAGRWPSPRCCGDYYVFEEAATVQRDCPERLSCGLQSHHHQHPPDAPGCNSSASTPSSSSSSTSTSTSSSDGEVDGPASENVLVGHKSGRCGRRKRCGLAQGRCRSGSLPPPHQPPARSLYQASGPPREPRPERGGSPRADPGRRRPHGHVGHVGHVDDLQGAAFVAEGRRLRRGLREGDRLQGDGERRAVDIEHDDVDMEMAGAAWKTTTTTATATTAPMKTAALNASADREALLVDVDVDVDVDAAAAGWSAGSSSVSSDVDENVEDFLPRQVGGVGWRQRRRRSGCCSCCRRRRRRPPCRRQVRIQSRDGRQPEDIIVDDEDDDDDDRNNYNRCHACAAIIHHHHHHPDLYDAYEDEILRTHQQEHHHQAPRMGGPGDLQPCTTPPSPPTSITTPLTPPPASEAKTAQQRRPTSTPRRDGREAEEDRETAGKGPLGAEKAKQAGGPKSSPAGPRRPPQPPPPGLASCCPACCRRSGKPEGLPPGGPPQPPPPGGLHRRHHPRGGRHHDVHYYYDGISGGSFRRTPSRGATLRPADVGAPIPGRTPGCSCCQGRRTVLLPPPHPAAVATTAPSLTVSQSVRLRKPPDSGPKGHYGPTTTIVLAGGSSATKSSSSSNSRSRSGSVRAPAGTAVAQVPQDRKKGLGPRANTSLAAVPLGASGPPPTPDAKAPPRLNRQRQNSLLQILLGPSNSSSTSGSKQDGPSEGGGQGQQEDKGQQAKGAQGPGVCRGQENPCPESLLAVYTEWDDHHMGGAAPGPRRTPAASTPKHKAAAISSPLRSVEAPTRLFSGTIPRAPIPTPDDVLSVSKPSLRTRNRMRGKASAAAGAAQEAAQQDHYQTPNDRNGDYSYAYDVSVSPAFVIRYNQDDDDDVAGDTDEDDDNVDNNYVEDDDDDDDDAVGLAVQKNGAFLPPENIYEEILQLGDKAEDAGSNSTTTCSSMNSDSGIGGVGGGQGPDQPWLKQFQSHGTLDMVKKVKNLKVKKPGPGLQQETGDLASSRQGPPRNSKACWSLMASSSSAGSSASSSSAAVVEQARSKATGSALDDFLFRTAPGMTPSQRMDLRKSLVDEVFEELIQRHHSRVLGQLRLDTEDFINPDKEGTYHLSEAVAAVVSGGGSSSGSTGATGTANSSKSSSSGSSSSNVRSRLKKCESMDLKLKEPPPCGGGQKKVTKAPAKPGDEGPTKGQDDQHRLGGFQILALAKKKYSEVVNRRRLCSTKAEDDSICDDKVMTKQAKARRPLSALLTTSSPVFGPSWQQLPMTPDELLKTSLSSDLTSARSVRSSTLPPVTFDKPSLPPGVWENLQSVTGSSSQAAEQVTGNKDDDSDCETLMAKRFQRSKMIQSFLLSQKSQDSSSSSSEWEAGKEDVDFSDGDGDARNHKKGTKL